MNIATDAVDIRQKLLDFITAQFHASSMKAISANDNLLDLGVLDSLAIVLLIEHVSANYGAEIDPNDITPENFESVASIADLVGKHLGR